VISGCDTSPPAHLVSISSNFVYIYLMVTVSTRVEALLICYPVTAECRWCYFSQCSTVVHNTVVRATIKVNGKPQILGTSSPQTPESINLKFDLDDYVGGVTLRAKKWYKLAHQGWWGKGVKYSVQLDYFFFFTLLAKLWRTHFWEHCRIFALDAVFLWD